MAKSYTTLRNLFGTLSQNTSVENLALGDQLINDSHRYLLQKYFSNETTYAIPTAGGQTLILTAPLTAGSISATLTTPWTGNITRVQVTFSNGEIRMVNFETNSTAISWQVALNTNATETITSGGNQYYPLPPNYSKLKSITIQVGNLQWTLSEILTTAEWNQLNVFPYYADIPYNFFIYPGGDHGAQIGIWPIPATTGNVITFSYKYRVPDLSIPDYATGTVSVDSKTQAITGTTTSFAVSTNAQNESRWVQIPQPTGDNLWYQIQSIDSGTGLTLYQPYQGINVTNSGYTIGQMPILPEDFHDLLVYNPLYIYYSSISPDATKAANFKELYDERLKLLQAYSGTNTANVNLSARISQLNPNSFQQNIGI